MHGIGAGAGQLRWCIIHDICGSIKFVKYTRKIMNILVFYRININFRQFLKKVVHKALKYNHNTTVLHEVIEVTFRQALSRL